MEYQLIQVLEVVQTGQVVGGRVSLPQVPPISLAATGSQRAAGILFCREGIPDVGLAVRSELRSRRVIDEARACRLSERLREIALTLEIGRKGVGPRTRLGVFDLLENAEDEELVLQRGSPTVPPAFQYGL